MFVVSKDNKSVINLDETTCVYIGSNETTIKVDFKNGRGTQVASFNSSKECAVALQILLEQMSENKTVIKIPMEKEIQAYLISTGQEKSRHISGKKTKGYGGS